MLVFWHNDEKPAPISYLTPDFGEYREWSYRDQDGNCVGFSHFFEGPSITHWLDTKDIKINVDGEVHKKWHSKALQGFIKNPTFLGNP